LTENGHLVSYCGLLCGDCFNHKGKIADLARDLRKELRQESFETVSKGLSKYFRQFEDYGQCYEVLGAMVRLRCKRTCRGGGGPPSCRIRRCCQTKVYQGCWDCEGIDACNKLDSLKPIHGDAHIRNIMKIKKQGIDYFLKDRKSPTQ